MDISLYIFKFHFHFSLVLCPSLKQSNGLPHPGCLLFISNQPTRTNSHRVAPACLDNNNMAASSSGKLISGGSLHVTHTDH